MRINQRRNIAELVRVGFGVVGTVAAYNNPRNKRLATLPSENIFNLTIVVVTPAGMPSVVDVVATLVTGTVVAAIIAVDVDDAVEVNNAVVDASCSTD
jgi:hypothetical protein